MGKYAIFVKGMVLLRKNSRKDIFVKNSVRHGSFWRLAVFLFIFLFFSIQPAYSGEFDVSEQDPTAVVAIPGANMKAGVFKYLFKYDWTTKKRQDCQELLGEKLKYLCDEYDWTGKAGILINDEVLYYVHDGNYEYSMFDPGGDCNFGVYKDYFLMDCWSSGASHNRIMYLFRFGKGTVELLDVIGEATVAKGELLDFMSVFSEASKPGFQRMGYRLPIWMDINDLDGDGSQEIGLWIIISDYIDDFVIYVEIKDDRLSVDFNPKLYKPLFEEEKKKEKNKSRSKTYAYYIYGFLSGDLQFEEIRTRLKSNMKQYKRIVPLLEQQDTWDEAFHFDELPALIRYDLKQRQTP